MIVGFIKDLFKDFLHVKSHQILKSKLSENGDFSSNLAFLLTKEYRSSPMEVAKKIYNDIASKLPSGLRVELKNGYINFFIEWPLIKSFLMKKEKGYKHNGVDYINLEYISSNPTGPLNVVQARAGVYGDVLGNMMKYVGINVGKEFYINDAGRQRMLLTQSIIARIKELKGEESTFPEEGYKGDYIFSLARDFVDESIDSIGEKSIEEIVNWQKSSLKKIGIFFDKFVKESFIRSKGYPERVLEILKDKGFVYERDGALWFKSSNFGDDKDRVLVRSNGEITYFLADLGYHFYKYERGYKHFINILGPDHHGYIKRIKAGTEVFTGQDLLEVIIVQQVNLKENGKKKRFSKREGRFVLLDEVVDLIGSDVLRTFLLLRHHEQILDFDIELAQKESMDNPAYYLQYAVARLKNIVRKSNKEPLNIEDIKEIGESERRLFIYILYFDDLILRATQQKEPHQLLYYLIEVAKEFHRYYENYRVIGVDEEQMRLFLVEALIKMFVKGMELLSISVPERM